MLNVFDELDETIEEGDGSPHLVLARSNGDQYIVVGEYVMQHPDDNENSMCDVCEETSMEGEHKCLDSEWCEKMNKIAILRNIRDGSEKLMDFSVNLGNASEKLLKVEESLIVEQIYKSNQE